MSYKVSYYTLALMPDDKVGNIKQEVSHVFTDLPISEIPAKLNEFLKPKDRVGVIEKIEDVKGECMF